MPKKEKVTEELDQEKLGKIVRMAKLGTGGKQANAIRIIKSICKKHNLIFDDVMNNIEVRDFEIAFKTNDEKEVLICCIYRYGFLKYGDSFDISNYYKKVRIKTTNEKYIEVINAFSVLKSLYKKEKERSVRALFLAFRTKHDLYYQPTDEEWKKIEKERRKRNKEKNDEDEKVVEMAHGMARAMEDAQILKQLE